MTDAESYHWAAKVNLQRAERAEAEVERLHGVIDKAIGHICYGCWDRVLPTLDAANEQRLDAAGGEW